MNKLIAIAIGIFSLIGVAYLDNQMISNWGQLLLFSACVAAYFTVVYLGGEEPIGRREREEKRHEAEEYEHRHAA